MAHTRRVFALVVIATLPGGPACTLEEEPELSKVEHDLLNPPIDARFVPADYDNDGLTDFAVKGSNGVWYIDLARCSGSDRPETECSNNIDDDLDGLVNDGCPPVGTTEATIAEGCDAPYGTAFDNDNDGYIDDGCPTNRRCLGGNGYGGRWDFAYAGYGDDTAIPVPADYGTTTGGHDGKADLAIKAADGMWAIDYADNGFGTFDFVRFGYGDSTYVPIVGDFDGDERADLAVRGTDGAGRLYFDYSSDGFNGWNAPCAGGCPCNVQPGPGHVAGYGGALDLPAIGNFNGDMCDDISVKTNSGHWYFDLSGDGFGWQAPCPGCAVPLAGYGDSSHRPFVANYDPDYPDGKDDLAVLMPDGYFAIDFSADGFGEWNTSPFYYLGWAGSQAQFGAGRFGSTSGNLDISVKSSSGWWYIDRGYNGYGGLDLDYSTSRALVDRNHPHIDEMWISQPSVPAGPTSGNFSEVPALPNQLKIGVRYTANVHITNSCAGTSDLDGDGAPNDGCRQVFEAETQCLDWSDNDADGYLNDGCPAVGTPEPGAGEGASVGVNPDLHVSPALTVQDIGGHVVQNSAEPVHYEHYRRLGFTCTQAGVFPLGFMLSAPGTATAMNADHGFNVVCSADHPGIYGFVKNKRTGAPISGARVIAGGVERITNASGFWNVATLTGGPHKVLVSKSQFAPAEAVNVRVPSSGAPAGVQVDTPLEEAFVLPQGITYKTYIDYSRGRNIMHTVRIDVTRAPITLGKVNQLELNEAGVLDFVRLLQIARNQNAPVMMNGIWWSVESPPWEPKNYVKVIGENRCEFRPGPNLTATTPIGYLYMNGHVTPGICNGDVCRPGEPECASGEYYEDPVPGRLPAPPALIQDPWQTPMFAVKGSGTQRRANVMMTDTDFVTSNNGWKRAAGVPNCPAGKTCPIYDAVLPSGQSDYTYAFQMGHVLLRNGYLIARGVIMKLGTGFPGEFAYARTSVGTNAAGTVTWFVVADGEGIDAGNGGTPHQMGQFYRDILGASDAMIVDSGESTELIIRGASGPRRVNTLSSENHAADGIAPDGDYTPSGRVFAYLKAGN